MSAYGEILNTMAVPFSATVGAADAPLLGPNSDRVALIFSPHNTNRYTVSLDSLAVIDVGLTIPPNSQPFKVTCNEVGNCLQQPLRAIAGGAGTVVSGLEIIKVK